MAAFKNEKNGTWYVQFRYTDWKGEQQQKLKRGFATKREAQEWERAFLTEKKADVTMPFKTFVELYEKDVRPKLKENTWLTKEHIIKTKILPYFEQKRLCDITAKDVIAWQNEIRKEINSSGKSLSQGYLKTIHNQLSALFNHAIRIYGLKLNPAATVGNMGKEERKEMDFWTVEEYTKFSNEMMDKPVCLSLPEEEQKPVGIWGQRHLRYIKEHKRAFYTNLLTSCKLNSYLSDIDKQAEDMFLRLVKQMAEREGVSEQLKTENQMEWVGRMNNIRNRAMEIVNAELIYS